MKYNDQTPMPSGFHKDKKLIDVPAEYLIWCFENNKCNASLRAYIEDNMNVLRDEIRRNKLKVQSFHNQSPEGRRSGH